MMKAVPPDDHINSGMHFDPADFRSGKFLFIVDMMNLIILNNGEYASQMSHDSSLSTVVNITAPDYM